MELYEPEYFALVKKCFDAVDESDFDKIYKYFTRLEEKVGRETTIDLLQKPHFRLDHQNIFVALIRKRHLARNTTSHINYFRHKCGCGINTFTNKKINCGQKPSLSEAEFESRKRIIIFLLQMGFDPKTKIGIGSKETLTDFFESNAETDLGVCYFPSVLDLLK